IKNKCESIAFPLISSGSYGYPKQEALRIAREEIQAYLLKHEVEVSLVVFDKETLSISKSLLGEIQAYIDDHYVEEHFEARSALSSSFAPFRGAKKKKDRMEESAVYHNAKLESARIFEEDNLEGILANLDEPFSDTLLRLIDSKEMSDVEVYKRANIDRKLFSKIRSVNGYVPTKRTILALAIAMQLSLEETNALLKCAGYALSHSVRFDLIVEHYIQKKSYDLFEINEVLFYYDQPLLGAEK
ncbi:MAG: macro domain-containing protein, partial [Tannerellaceae bacterium]